MARTEIESFMTENGITVESVFIPFSRSRNKDQDHRSLNWRVTIKKNGREILTTDYSAGIAHSPSYKATTRPQGYAGNLRMWKEDAVALETEEGYTARRAAWGGIDKKSPIMPDSCNVIWSLAMESDALDYPSFKDWASCFGYDHDSRKGETIYRACLETALKMRAGLGDSALAALREACQDY